LQALVCKKMPHIAAQKEARGSLRLYQIPFSHNCIKVRKALDMKGLEYERVNIDPILRIGLRRATGQALVPALVDDGRAVADSTAILLYLEDR
jgi:glutathione S-transferase